jgi:hypothetical protein
MLYLLKESGIGRVAGDSSLYFSYERGVHIEVGAQERVGLSTIHNST